jgi:hypothetical protein
VPGNAPGREPPIQSIEPNPSNLLEYQGFRRFAVFEQTVKFPEKRGVCGRQITYDLNGIPRAVSMLNKRSTEGDRTQ